MELDDFKEVLEEQGIGYREAGQSLVVELCPECGRDKYKVFFRVVDVDEDDPFFGRCLSGSCNQNYSSFSYLKRIGLPFRDNMQLHGKDPEEALVKLDPAFRDLDLSAPQKEEKPQYADKDITDFVSVESASWHPTAKYAISRGYTKEQSDIIKLDLKTSAVVFVVRGENGGVKGYQKRYTVVSGNMPKTKTSEGFKVSENIYEIPNKGPVVICEGPFTALAAWHWGFHAISTFGSNISKQQLEKIGKIAKGKELLIAEELDDAGRKFFKKITCYFDWYGVRPLSIFPKTGDDLNDAWMAGAGYVIKESAPFNPALPEFIL